MTPTPSTKTPRKKRWIDELKSSRIYGQFNNLVNRIVEFSRKFPKPKYKDNFSQLQLPLSELMRIVEAEKPPSDVMVATLSGVIQTEFEELRKKKSGRHNLEEFSKRHVACLKALTNFIHELQNGIRMIQQTIERRVSMQRAATRWYEGCDENEVQIMKEAISTIKKLKTQKSRGNLNSWLLQHYHQSQMDLKLGERETSDMMGALTHVDTPEVLKKKIKSLEADELAHEGFECSLSYFKKTLANTLARNPILSICGLALMNLSLGYVVHTGTQKYSGFQHDGDVVRVWVPFLLCITGLGIFIWSWMIGHGGQTAAVAICDFGKGPCCGVDCCTHEDGKVRRYTV